jgi:hypothetical protein
MVPMVIGSLSQRELTRPKMAAVAKSRLRIARVLILALLQFRAWQLLHATERLSNTSKIESSNDGQQFEGGPEFVLNSIVFAELPQTAMDAFRSKYT